MKKVLFFLAIAFLEVSYAQTLPPKQAYPLTVKQIHSGHSLTDPLFHPWPGQYRYLINDVLSGIWDNLGKSTIPGSPMFWRWDNELSQGLDPSARHDIADWELLIITEGIPIPNDGGNPATIFPAKDYLSRYVNNAWNNGNNGNGTPTLLWTTWTNIDDSDGPWRATLDTYEAHWEEMMDYANANRPSGATPVYIIPGHKMMARLYDDIQAGLVPGITTINEFFSDTIHLNDLGAYAMAMIHYACIYNQSPVGLTNTLWAPNIVNSHTIPSATLATYLQTMVWDVVTSYDRTGITSTLSNDNLIKNKLNLKAFPNPANTILNISFTNDTVLNEEIGIYNLLGQKMYQGKETTIDISTLTNGTYIVKIKNEHFKFVKK